MKLDQPPIPQQSRVDQLLSRPPDERAREFKYRFAQSLVFGLPVVALQIFGPWLGGPEAPRWTGLFQTLLAGWVMYIAAAGMIFEGALLLARGRLSIDFIVAAAAAALYIASVVAWALRLSAGEPPRVPMLYHYAVIVLILWCGARWAWLSRGNHSGGPMSMMGGSMTK